MYPSLFCSHRQGPLTKHPSLSNRPNIIDTYPWVAGLSSLPAHRVIQTLRSHPCVGTKAPHPLITTEAVSLSPRLFPPAASGVHSVPECNCVVLHGMQYPLPPTCEYRGLINCCQFSLSSVSCHAFGHPHKLLVGSPPLPMGWRDD